MISRRARIITLWLCVLAAAAVIAARVRYAADLSAFLPAHPSAAERLLVDQLRDGPGTRILLIGLSGGTAAARAAMSRALATRLRADPAFSMAANGAETSAQRDREFLFAHRYLLSDAVTAERFTRAGLAAALAETQDDLAGAEGLILKPLVPHDPTGEMLGILDALSRLPAPHSRDGIWVSPDGERALLIAQTAASGSDTDAQERAIDAIRAAFAAARAKPAANANTGGGSGTGDGSDDAGTASQAAKASARSGPSAVRLIVSGAGVFAVEARAAIVRAVVRLSILSSLLIIVILGWVYRSGVALILGLLPVATGALVGIAVVALGFGVIHGITLGFGVTLIGESVDYSIYFFVQSLRTERVGWQRSLWPIMRLGMLTSVCGFASLLPSGFPGLAQLGAYSIGGLLAAAAVTRFVLPVLLPPRLAIRDLEPFGARLGRILQSLASHRFACGLAATVLALAAGVILARADMLWNRELSSLSPTPAATAREDALLRADLGEPDVLDLVIVAGSDLESALRGAERTANVLAVLVEQQVIGGFDTPTDYLPSLATQSARRDALPPPATLRATLHSAVAGLDLDERLLEPFLGDVESARHARLLTRQDLAGTSLAAAFGTMIMHRGAEWDALLPLRAPPGAARIDGAAVQNALHAAGLGEAARFLDPKADSDALYGDYLHEVMRSSLAGLVAITILLWVALRSPRRAARVLAPLGLAVLTVTAMLALCHVQLSILHLVGMLLIVAVGSNYALFFEQSEATPASLTLASLMVANLCTVLGFGVLSFSNVPVLEALGTTVAPGTLLALVFAAVLIPPRSRSAAPARAPVASRGTG